MHTYPRMRWCGGLGLADVYSDDLGSTICGAATRAMRPPKEEGTRCLPIAFLGDKTPVVGHVGMRALAPTLGLLVGDPHEIVMNGAKARPVDLMLVPLACRQ
jgi:hypothetical protein